MKNKIIIRDRYGVKEKKIDYNLLHRLIRSGVRIFSPPLHTSFSSY
ncbi:MAG: hypothetical protein IJZ61_05980 [Oscillospiraceae bacterium]|nr:hypothetical protein [Oscillospiraceae bacterium]